MSKTLKNAVNKNKNMKMSLSYLLFGTLEMRVSYLKKFVLFPVWKVIYIIFLDSTKLKIVRIKITTFFKRRVSIIL